MRKLLLGLLAVAAFAVAFNPPAANAVFWRGVTAPTNIDIHGYPIIKEPPPSTCQLIHVNGYWVRQCLELSRRYWR